jgi:prevent-host-death family protein
MNISIAHAKAHLSELLKRVERGEEIIIERHGKPVARLTAEPAKKEPLDIEALKRHLANMPKSDTPAGETVRKMRDDARY